MCARPGANAHGSSPRRGIWLPAATAAGSGVRKRRLIKEFVEICARYDAVLVLNIDAELAAAMARQLAAARALKPEQRVIALDRRDSQAALEKAELLTRDDEVQRYWRYGGVRN